ncbi:MAG: hypothetical protein H7336_03000 [Bacteriovorax sp.]|nr:hypothetical protein [Bacteriovorax sp.]
MKSILLSILLVLTNSSQAVESKALSGRTVRSDLTRGMPRETLVIDADSFYDIKFDYDSFSGRVTDRDATTSIVKISSENKNVKFFRAGDLVEFRIQASKDSDYCEGFVRSIEPDYFVMYTKDLQPCFPKEEYFRRGTALVMRSVKLGQRVREASVYRASLINKKKDFMGQLNGINGDVWNFEEKKIQVAADYDRRITEMEKEKIKALDELLSRKNDQIKLQREIAFRLDNIDKELDFYRIEKQDLMFDRWHLDHDLGYPVYERPEEIRPRRASGEKVLDD